MCCAVLYCTGGTHASVQEMSDLFDDFKDTEQFHGLIEECGYDEADIELAFETCLLSMSQTSIHPYFV